MPSTFTPKPFKIAIPDEALRDLKDRLQRSRIPDELVEGSKWSNGIDREYLTSLVEYWKNEFDWRKQEELLNKFPHYTVSISSQEIHYIHLPSPHPTAQPLLLTHGWPGSFFEFYKVLEPLTNPPDGFQAFHVVVPSLPGFGFSGKNVGKGFGLKEVAAVFVELMKGLGYGRFFA
ncbi:hypothetical protein HDU67_005166, partial [Dinochytrium kinnereticum]